MLFYAVSQQISLIFAVCNKASGGKHAFKYKNK